MKLQEIFQYLTSGELSQLSIGGGEAGVIRPEDYRKVMQSINLGLIQLFTRFNLRQGSLKVLLYPDIQRYSLTYDRAASNTRSKLDPKYLDDTDLPYADDLAKVLSVKTSGDYELDLNEEDNPLSCHIPSQKVLVVPGSLVRQSVDLPDHLKTDYLTVKYQAVHPMLDVSEDADIDPEYIEVDLPYQFLEPLLFFVASRAYFPVSLGTELNPASSYFGKYEQACALLENKNVDGDNHKSFSKFHTRGFV